MTTLTLNSKPIREVPLEDWYEELADESLDPLNILIAEEETIIPTKEPAMTTTIANNKSFDLNTWMNTLAVLTEVETPETTKVINKPEWLEIKGPLVASNNFAITAGVIKAARRITDSLFVAKNRHNVAVEALVIQEARALRETGEKGLFGPEMSALGLKLAELGSGRQDAPGFNPDGVEFTNALEEAEKEVVALEVVIENGSAMMNELLKWIEEVTPELQLQVETGHTITTDLIGNTFRKPRYEPLNASTLMYGIAAQKEFIRSNRR